MKIIITEQQSKQLKRILSEESDYDMDENINWDIKTTDCEGIRFGNMSSMGVDEDEDGNIVATIRYCKGDHEELEYLKKKARMEIESNYGMGNTEDETFDY